MEEMMNGFGTAELLIMLGLGVAVLCFGYRIKKAAFFIAWFILGYTGMTYLMPQIMQWLPEVAATQLYQILIPIAGGLLLALLGFSIEKFCISAIVFALTMLVAVQYFGSDIQTLAIAGVIGVILGGVSTIILKPACIIATAGVGGYAVTLALLRLIPNIDYGTFYWPMIIGFTCVGALIQFMTTKKVS